MRARLHLALVLSVIARAGYGAEPTPQPTLMPSSTPTGTLAAALRRHQQHVEDGCDRGAWHVLARHLIERAVWSANSTEEAVRDGRPLPWNPNIFNQHDH